MHAQRDAVIKEDFPRLVAECDNRVTSIQGIPVDAPRGSNYKGLMSASKLDLAKTISAELNRRKSVLRS
jgi:hypothetical protein